MIGAALLLVAAAFAVWAANMALADSRRSAPAERAVQERLEAVRAVWDDGAGDRTGRPSPILDAIFRANVWQLMEGVPEDPWGREARARALPASVEGAPPPRARPEASRSTVAERPGARSIAPVAMIRVPSRSDLAPVLEGLRLELDRWFDWQSLEHLAPGGLGGTAVHRPDVRDYLSHRYASVLEAALHAAPRPGFRVLGSEEHSGGDVTVTVAIVRGPITVARLRLLVRPAGSDYRLLDVQAGDYSVVSDLRAAYFKDWRRRATRSESMDRDPE